MLKVDLVEAVILLIYIPHEDMSTFFKVCYCQESRGEDLSLQEDLMTKNLRDDLYDVLRV